MSKADNAIIIAGIVIILIAVGIPIWLLAGNGSAEPVLGNDSAGQDELVTIPPDSDSDLITDAAVAGDFNAEALDQCVECQDAETWNSMPCCTADFERDCAAQGGVVRWQDLHPAFSGLLNGCFMRAPDAGKECSANQDCLSGVCDLESAAVFGSCSLIEKVLTGSESQYTGETFYTARYQCETLTPGICLEARENLANPGGILHTFAMDGDVLVETLASGPIR